MDKVQGGTPRGFESMCVTCRYAQVVRGLNLQSAIVCHYASQAPQVVRFPVERCSTYDDKRMPPLYQMREIAWNISARNRGPVGFGDASYEIKVTPPEPGQQNQPLPTITAKDEE